MGKRILCYGDSNTWGFVPSRGFEGKPYAERYPSDVRWPGALQRLLGGGYTVIEEGLNGRTTVWDDPVKPYRNGLRYFEACVESHAPLDLIVIMLGTNDLKTHINGSAYVSAEGVGKLAQRALQSQCGREGAAPQLLLVSPILITEEVEQAPFGGEFREVSEACRQSGLLAGCLQAKAAGLGCAFLDAARYAQAAADGVHLDEKGHAALAQAVKQKVEELV
ncbi:SGNH/GDSL hydrolase family protein [Christensenellaceae bacterium OttesenSCG-928-K19]|nr:SGNH/GDSL hydrolase family protein [Christensenellaceae bacterium OttesenSCG-928-K19]